MSEPDVERRYTQKDFLEHSPDLLYQRKQTSLRDLLVNLGLLQNTRNTSGRKSQPPTRGIYFKDASALAVFFADVLSTIDALATTLGIEDAGDQSALADILRDPLRQKIIESYAASTSGDCEDD